MSVAILLAEATLLPSVDLSLFSILIKSVGTQEVLVQVDRACERFFFVWWTIDAVSPFKEFWMKISFWIYLEII